MISDNIVGIMFALKGRLGTIPNLQTFAAYPGKPSPDSAWPSLGSHVGREVTFGGAHFSTMVNITVVTGVWGGDMEQAQIRLYRYISPFGERSIRAAILEDETLGGIIHCMPQLGPWEEPGTLRIADIDYVGATLPIEILD